MRLIDADALKADAEMGNDCSTCRSDWRKCQYDKAYPKMDVCAWIDDAPTVDAVTVVRCRDCTHYELADNRAFGFPGKRCEWTGFEDMDEDDFCSRGKRKERDGNGS